MDNLRIFHLWAAAAWADGVIHPTEATALARWIDAAEDFTPDVRKQATAMIITRPEVDLEEVRKLSPEAREGVYRAAIGIVAIDGKVVDAERAFLERLKAVLDLNAAIVQRIERERR